MDSGRLCSNEALNSFHSIYKALFCGQRMLPHELSSLPLMSQQDNCSQQQDVGQLESAEGPLISHVLIEMMLDGVDGRSEENAELVGQAGHESASGVRRKLVEVRRNNSPGSLYTHLHEKRSQGEPGEA